MKVSPRTGTVLRVLAALGVALLALATVPTSAFYAKVTNSTSSVTSAPFFTCRAATTAPASDYVVVPAGRDRRHRRHGRLRQQPHRAVLQRRGELQPAGPVPPRHPERRDHPEREHGVRVARLRGRRPPNPNVFTVGIWFRTTTTRGGKLIGLGNLATGSSTNYDRHISMSNAGLLYFGVYPNAVRTVNGWTAYNDGQWHQAVATLSGAGWRCTSTVRGSAPTRPSPPPRSTAGSSASGTTT